MKAKYRARHWPSHAEQKRMEVIEQNGNTGEHYPILYPELSARLKNIKLDPSSVQAHYDIRHKEWKALPSPYYYIVKMSDGAVDDRYAIWVGSDIINFNTLLLYSKLNAR